MNHPAQQSQRSQERRAGRATVITSVVGRFDEPAQRARHGVDGSPGGLGGIITTLSGATALVGSPAAGTRVYAVTDTGLADLNATVRGPRVLDEGLTFVTYAG